MTSPFSAQRPFIWGVQGQTNVICGPGACDPTLRASLSGLKPFRYATGAFTGTIAAAGSPIIIAANSTITLGAEGVGDALTQAGLSDITADTSFTDLEKGGAASPRNYYFLLTGLACAVLNPFQLASSTFALTYSNWINADFGYDQPLITAVTNFTAISVRNDDNGCEQRLGCLRDYPEIGGNAGDRTIRNGLTSLPGVYTPFVATYLMGPKDESQAKFTLKLSEAITIENNPVSPTVVSGYANSGDVKIPVRMMFIGMLVCVPAASVCDPSQYLAQMNAQPVG